MQYFQHFKSEEFFPNCSQGEIAYCIAMNFFDNLLTLLQCVDIIRDRVQFPIILTSTYRDELHNKSVGGSPISQHMIGSAIDFKCPSLDFESFVLLVIDALNDCAIEQFIGQVIFYHKRKFVHLGLRTKSRSKSILHYEKGDN